MSLTHNGPEEQQLRFAFLQSGEVIILATGGIVNFAVSFSSVSKDL